MTPWFTLPPELAAHSPPEFRGLARDEVRLLVTYKEKDRLTHATFRELPDFLRKGDLLVVNNSATLPAALTARRSDGTEIALHLSTHRYPQTWVVEPRRTTPTPGEILSLPAGATATLQTRYKDSARLWLAHLRLPTDHLTYLHQHGRPIHYDYVPAPYPLSAYQTIFSQIPGSAEMPSAARPFTPRTLTALKQKGIHLAPITLHTGVASLESNEPPYEEWFHIPTRTACLIHQAQSTKNRIIAIGTTVIRALESWGSGADRAQRGRTPRRGLGGPGERSVPRRPGHSGWTNLIITPQHQLTVVNGLLTGLHDPTATHLHMLQSLTNPSHIRRAYRAALESSYLWHEFGDVHLIL